MARYQKRRRTRKDYSSQIEDPEFPGGSPPSFVIPHHQQGGYSFNSRSRKMGGVLYHQTLMIEGSTANLKIQDYDEQPTIVISKTSGFVSLTPEEFDEICRHRKHVSQCVNLCNVALMRHYGREYVQHRRRTRAPVGVLGHTWAANDDVNYCAVSKSKAKQSRELRTPSDADSVSDNEEDLEITDARLPDEVLDASDFEFESEVESEQVKNRKKKARKSATRTEPNVKMPHSMSKQVAFTSPTSSGTNSGTHGAHSSPAAAPA